MTTTEENRRRERARMNRRLDILRHFQGCDNCSIKHFKEAVDQAEALVKKGWTIKQAVAEVTK